MAIVMTAEDSIGAPTGVVRVVHRCEDAMVNQRLDLSACFLASFPDAIFMLMRNTQLESLDLSRNVIRKIPSKVPRKFTGITSLNLASNRLFNLPDEISELENLTHLDLSGNDFTSVPWCLYRMPQLRFLNLSNNHIIDVDVAGLKRLDCEIHLENNPLTSQCCAQLAEETLPRVSYIPLKQEEYV